MSQKLAGARQAKIRRDDAGMPKVFEKDGYRFFFYRNEHRPIHVHVRHGAGEAVFNVEPVVELRESFGLKVRKRAHLIFLHVAAESSQSRRDERE